METSKDEDDHTAEYSWMIRSCVLYEEEYKDCKSIKSRFHQQFVYGKFLDCAQWKRDYDNCKKWRGDKNIKSYEELIESEKSRRIDRLIAHRENDVWEKRTSPPITWNNPLPQWMQEKMKTSFLSLKANEIKNPEVQRTFCVIM